MEIPADLVAAVAERRVIPFVGAGFSASVGMPDWNQLLARLAAETEGSLPYDELHRHTGGDFLQIAEYLYLKSDQRIGPLRHVIERGLPEGMDPTLSAAHVELANLRAPQIYTTNYDDLLEHTYRALGLPVNVVALGKDVAVAGQQTTQVVKYHGDLRHENTLVLTESSYYKRLDFESAMDVKFRADLLGRSVLFMGYSFRDINIRLIWFKLNQMMEDIPTADRRQSYIVRLEPNPVLEELYEAVGLKTLVLDPVSSDPRAARRRNVRAREYEEVTSLGDFLAQLARRAATRARVPEVDLFASMQLIERAETVCERHEKVRGTEHGRLAYLEPPRELAALFERRVPPTLQGRVDEIAIRALGIPPASYEMARYVTLRAQEKGASKELTWFACSVLARIGPIPNSLRRKFAESDEVDWATVWSGHLDKSACDELLEKFEIEINYNRGAGVDADIAYSADIAKRIASGQLVDPGQREECKERAERLLVEAAEMYPAVKEINPAVGPPDLQAVLEQIDARQAGSTLDDDDGAYTQVLDSLLNPPSA